MTTLHTFEFREVWQSPPTHFGNKLHRYEVRDVRGAPPHVSLGFAESVWLKRQTGMNVDSTHKGWIYWGHPQWGGPLTPSRPGETWSRETAAQELREYITSLGASPPVHVPARDLRAEDEFAHPRSGRVLCVVSDVKVRAMVSMRCCVQGDPQGGDFPVRLKATTVVELVGR